MATRINGNDLVIFAAATGETPAKIAHIETASLSISNSLIDVTTKDSASWAEEITGRKSWTMSAEGKLHYDDGAALTSAIELATLFLAGTTVDLQLGVGNARFEGTAFIETFDQSAGTDDAASYSISFTGTGALTYDADVTS